jgi:hypothetical protein
LSLAQQQEFRQGMTAVLNYLEGFWMGLEWKPPDAMQTWTQPAQRQGSELRGHPP